MEIKEVFLEWYCKKNNNTISEDCFELENIASEYAIEFAEWCIKWRVEFIDDTREGILYTYGGLYEKFTMSQLLEIYKNQTEL